MDAFERKQAELRADIAERRQRMAMDDVSEWQVPEVKQPKQRNGSTVTEQKDWSAWERWCDGRIMKMLGPDSVHFNAVAEALSLLRAELRKEFAEQLGQLRAELNVQVGVQRGEISQLKSEVPVRKRDAA